MIEASNSKTAVVVDKSLFIMTWSCVKRSIPLDSDSMDSEKKHDYPSIIVYQDILFPLKHKHSILKVPIQMN